MRILFTGASSFSGLWFVEELVHRGHDVVAFLHRNEEAYEGLRAQRLHRLKQCCKIFYAVPFGSERCLQLIENEAPWDLFCHHAADVANYKQAEFDFVAAVASNTYNIKKICELLLDQGCRKILLTGSLFEQREGLGSNPERAVSPYGLSKGMTNDVFHYFADANKMKMGKFVIPNPFGPYEEMRFTSYLANSWLQRQVAEVKTPDYVRDNVPVSLLAKSYAVFAEELTDSAGFSRLNPSFQPGTQSAFVETFAREMRCRLGVPCEYTLHAQTSFPEPKVRINSDKLDAEGLGWNESRAWDQLADFYVSQYAR